MPGFATLDRYAPETDRQALDLGTRLARSADSQGPVVPTEKRWLAPTERIIEAEAAPRSDEARRGPTSPTSPTRPDERLSRHGGPAASKRPSGGGVVRR